MPLGGTCSGFFLLQPQVRKALLFHQTLTWTCMAQQSKTQLLAPLYHILQHLTKSRAPRLQAQWTNTLDAAWPAPSICPVSQHLRLREGLLPTSERNCPGQGWVTLAQLLVAGKGQVPRTGRRPSSAQSSLRS